MPPIAERIAETADCPCWNSSRYIVIWPSVMRAAIARERDPRVRAVERRGRDQAEHEAPRVAPHRQVAILARTACGRCRGSARGTAGRARTASPPSRGPRARAPSRGRSACASRASASGTAGTLSPENFASATNAGRPASTSTATAHGEKLISSVPKLISDDCVLHEAERAHHQRQRTARRLAPRARQLVVELGVLEVRQLERQRLLEDHHVDALAELRAQQRLAERDAALRAGDRSDHSPSPPTSSSAWRSGRAIRGSRLNRGDDGIDDQRADVRDCRRQRAGDQRENCECDVSVRLVVHTSSSARWLYAKTPRKPRVTFGADGEDRLVGLKPVFYAAGDAVS